MVSRQSLVLRARSAGIVVSGCVILWATALAAPAGAASLPDGRGFELVSNVAGESGEEALNGASPLFYDTSNSGNAIDWQAFGACCGAAYGGANAYQSERRAAGWEVHAISPTPPAPPVNFLELQEEVFASEDLG